MLGRQQKPGAFKHIIEDISESVEQGSSLSEAFANHPRTFDRLYVNMIKAGEAGGILDTILQRLADFMEKAQRLKKKVIGAMIYPIIVMSVAVMILTGIMIFVSFFEHEVMVMADRGISKVVDQKEWDKIVANIISHIKKNKVADGMVLAIERCAEVLIENGFTRTKDDVNELRDDLRLED